MDHLLLHYGKPNRLWSLVFRSFGISWVLSRSVASTLFGWWNWLGKHSSSIWNLAPLCLMWCLWSKKTWIVPMTSYWLPLVALCLTGLGLGDSPLVILSLVFLALSCVTSFFSFLSSFFFLLFLFPLYFPSALCIFA